jgi:hypothetical protein
MVDICNEKLFKVLAPELGLGFTKADLVEFMAFFEKECNLQVPILPENDMNKLMKECSVTENKT